ncbi:MAG: amino acid ABC transporter permease [Candidatus Limnocylindria bacterium]
MSSEVHRAGAGAVPVWRDVRVLRVAAQVDVLIVLGLVIAFLARNFASATEQRGLGFGISFLGRQAGFEIDDSLIPYSARDSYGTAFLVGLLNTLFVSVVGIILATILGIGVGIARLSPNWLVSRIAAGYVELIRNTPLLLQLIIIFFVVFLGLPPVRDSIAIGNVVYLNQRGLYVPGANATDGFPIWLGFCVAAVAAAVMTRIVARRREDAGRPVPRLRTMGILAAVALPVIGWIAAGGSPLAFDLPVLGRFNFSGGVEFSTGFAALLTGLVIYTAAFIGEVVRGAIQAVRRGQVEAARALGLSEGQVLGLVIFPQALRIIVPPLTSQYLNLAKNSSLAIAVGYSDLFKIGQTMSNQTGQPVPVIMLMMGTYLAISLVTSLLMNLYNRRVQVTER